MPSKPPFFAQERKFSCTLACLRMLLGFHGLTVSEDELFAAAEFEGYGIHVNELARLAKQFGLDSEITYLDLDEMKAAVRSKLFPIVFLDRLPIDGEFTIHAVIPVKVQRGHVVCLDPLEGERKIPAAEFEKARQRLSLVAVICRKT